MVQFLIKRFLGLCFVVVGVSFITFIIGYYAPGDPVRSMMGQVFDPVIYNQLKKAYGLDLPWYEQYFNFLARLLRGDLGFSYREARQPVWNTISRGLPASIELGFWGLIIQLLIGVPLGILSALKAGKWQDTSTSVLTLFLYSMPTFITGALVQIAIIQLRKNYGFQWPITGWGVPWRYTTYDLQRKLLPVLVYSAVGLAYFIRLARTSTLEVLRQDYIRTARAKGILERSVVFRHALRNALIPIITVIGVSLGFLITGALFTENIFNIPGIAFSVVSAITIRDYPVIQATTVLLAATVVLGNFISDILYTLVDPRIKIS